MENRVLLTTFTYPSELIAARGLLESEGIECFVRDELTAQIHNFYATAIGGIRMEVWPQDFERANQILVDSGFMYEAGALTASKNEILEINKEFPDQCPNCGSKEISAPEYSKTTFVISFFLFGIPLFFKSKRSFCFDCGAKFKRK